MFGEKTTGTSVAALIHRFTPQIRNYIEHRSGGASLDDLFQETVAQALASADHFEYRGDAQFLGWIYIIARRITTQAFRRSARLQALRLCGSGSSAAGVPAAGIPGAGGTPSSVAGRSEQCQRLASAIKSLPNQYREILILYRIEERPLVEVARILDKSKTATCHLLARALAKLSEALSE